MESVALSQYVYVEYKQTNQSLLHDLLLNDVKSAYMTKKRKEKVTWEWALGHGYMAASPVLL